MISGIRFLPAPSTDHWRHSHHHAQGEVPYQDLKPFSDAPMMIGGYLTTIVVAMIPPLWHKPCENDMPGFLRRMHQMRYAERSLPERRGVTSRSP
ncbi:hypothetical protein [Burkholderia stagnalis]